MTNKYHTSTITARARVGAPDTYGSVMPALHLSSNYTFAGLGQKRKYDYTRSGNPTRDALGDALCELENGAGAAVVASGMAAITLVLQLVNQGGLVIAPHDCYGGTHRLLTHLERRGLLRAEFVDQNDATALDAAFAQSPTLILIETPSNPLLRITDVRKVTELAKHKGAITVVDNTFLSPALQKPLDLGADIVIHSTTKYLNGHSDVVGGAAIAKTPEMAERLQWWANCIGITGAPFDAYQTLRGLRTLDVRIRQQSRTAEDVATFLNEHPAVDEVYYPGLIDHPGHDIAKDQQSGFGGMLSFELKGGVTAAAAFVDQLKLFTLAESLGGVESLIAHPATMTHAAMDEDARKTAGITDGLLRISVGLEHVDDLLADLSVALEARDGSTNVIALARTC